MLTTKEILSSEYWWITVVTDFGTPLEGRPEVFVDDTTCHPSVTSTQHKEMLVIQKE
jgi:hypothetical protein